MMKTMKFETRVHPFRHTGLTMIQTVEITTEETVAKAIAEVQQFVADDFRSRGFKVNNADVKCRKIT